jgi:hypothetical protein
MFLTAKHLIIAIVLIISATIFITHRGLAIEYYEDLQASRHPGLGAQRMDHGVHEIGKKMERYDLSRQECGKMFPLLNSEIDLAKSRGPIGKVPRKDDEHGFLRGRIHNGNVSRLDS